MAHTIKTEDMKYALTYDAVYRYAVWLRVEFERREKIAAKGKRRTTGR